FISGLYSNLGVLHLPKETMEAPEDNSISYQTHPIISSLIAKATKLHDKETLQATMEHHEALYGEGYPHSKNMATMCKAGLCLSTANFVYQLSSVLPPAQQFNLNIGLPHMRIHNALNSNPIFTAAHQVIAAAKLPPLWQSLGLDPNAYNQFLLDKTLSICELSAAIGFVNKLFTSLEKTNTNLAIIIRLQRTIKSLHSTGLSSLDVVEMLCEEENQISLDEMIDMDLMQAEFFYGAEFLMLPLKRFSKSETLAEDLCKACEEQIGIMEELFHSHVAKTFLHQLAFEREHEDKQNKEASIANAIGNEDASADEPSEDKPDQKEKTD
ncbi:MAG: hypothetical protein MI867_07715, partial [Pseudomonadales bacterium]|nr:hypothetical protein [Pseudomonadales bacterium]